MNIALWAVVGILLLRVQPLKASVVDSSPDQVIDWHRIEELPALLEPFREESAGLRTSLSKEEEKLALGTTPVLKPAFEQAKGYLRGVAEEEIA